MADPKDTPSAGDQLNEFLGKCQADLTSMIFSTAVIVGVKTGLFRELASVAPESVTASELAARLDFSPPLTLEWLRSMCAGGYVESELPAPEKDEIDDDEDWRVRFRMAPHHVKAFGDPASPMYMGGVFAAGLPIYHDIPLLVESFRTKSGISYDHHHPDLASAVEDFTASTYRTVPKWLTEDIFGSELWKRLQAPQTKILDVGCGSAPGVLCLGAVFPHATCVKGIDPSHAAIACARQRLSACPDPRLMVEQKHTSDLIGQEHFTLATMWDVVHDLPCPLAVLREVLGLLEPGGVLLTYDPAVQSRLRDNLPHVGKMEFALSMNVCLSSCLARDGGYNPADPSRGRGICLGRNRIRALLEDAGFVQVRAVDVADDEGRPSVFLARKPE